MMAPLFIWSSLFETGLDDVDAQHRHLFDLINTLHEQLLDEKIDFVACRRLLDELVQYAGYHFQTEERIMVEGGINPASQAEHREEHSLFALHVQQALKHSDNLNQDALQSLLDYLLNWLIYHVLDADQRMAREIAAIRAGASPEVVKQSEYEPTAISVTLLSQAMRAMHVLHSAYAHAQKRVFDDNHLLESEIAARTAELLADNQKKEQLLQELEHAQMQLLQSEKLASIGQLAAGVAHEINNPIGFVSSNLTSLQQYVRSLLRLIDAYESVDVTLSSPAWAQIAAVKTSIELPFLRQDILDLLNESSEGLERVKKIVQDLKDFARAGESEWQDADLHQGLESTINVAWSELKYKVKIVRQYGDLPPVHCMPAQLNQVFMNLLVNAAQAIKTQGVITIRTGVEGKQVWIEIEDDGKGMSPEVCARVFEPFFTTKPAGQGTGLGLPLSLEIVHKHGGELSVRSTPEVGSCFRLSVPIAGSQANAS